MSAESGNVWPSFESLGPDSLEEFGKKPRFENILGRFGYLLGDVIALGEVEYDNQIWRVAKFDMQTGQMNEYACKIVHIRLFTRMNSIERATNQVLKEAKLLLDADHECVIKVIDNIFIEDTVSKFPYLYIGSVMELMDGTVDGLLVDSPNLRLTEAQCFWVLKDVAQGIDYIHNQIRSPSGEWMRVVHMAIRTANVLYRIANDRNRYKLADFEECVIYNRNFRTDLWNFEDPNEFPPDLMPDPTMLPYALPMSAPEIRRARDADRTNLRLMPNDVFCLASLIAYCRVDNQTIGRERVVRMYEMLRNIVLLSTSDSIEFHVEDNTLDHLLMVAGNPDPNLRCTIREVLEHTYLNTEHHF